MDAPDSTTARLTQLRNGLLALHKALLESERDSYEHSIERITSSNQFLGLVLNDPWFAWLRELSQLVVVIDEIQDSKEKPPTAGDADSLVAKARALLVPSETGAGFQKGYFDAMQRDPDVVLAHGKMVKILTALARQL
ncbi:MAG: hypothetical protein ACR2NN_28530 [Bryobacteraceae bacterium]